ncbi:hypothetical protein [Aureimonas leprariae]|uniref:Uncharacterized protein n=1 Tax=Plantimonas leprariae TaxID=2615207 RepID=A0A7V7TY72_9HYPH|nr:hypothetical protein [Aureimonas leprariae]KAB0682060.1 hypothetical protein F6X38_04470 [Aureimonas leprariae]
MAKFVSDNRRQADLAEDAGKPKPPDPAVRQAEVVALANELSIVLRNAGWIVDVAPFEIDDYRTTTLTIAAKNSTKLQ